MNVSREYGQSENFPITYFEVQLESRLYPYVNWHDSVEIIYVNEGNTTFKLDNTQVKAHKGDVVVIWSNQFHSSYSTEYTDYRAIKVNLIQFIRIFRFHSLIEYFESLTFYDKITNKEISDLLIEIINYSKEKTDTCYLKATEKFYKFLLLLKEKPECFPLKQKVIEKAEKQTVELDVFDYIKTNFNKDITLESAASYVGYTQAHFLRIFKKITNKTFKNYLNEYRIDKSIYFMKMGQRVKDAAYNSGFNDVNTYIRNFKKYKKCNPSEYVNNELW